MVELAPPAVEPPPVVVHKPEVKLQRVRRPGPSALHVAANLKAQVFVDGLPVGWTPLTVEVSASTHLVMVWAEGSEAATERVVVGAEELVALNFDSLSLRSGERAGVRGRTSSE